MPPRNLNVPRPTRAPGRAGSHFCADSSAAASKYQFSARLRVSPCSKPIERCSDATCGNVALRGSLRQFGAPRVAQGDAWSAWRAASLSRTGLRIWGVEPQDVAGEACFEFAFSRGSGSREALRGRYAGGVQAVLLSRTSQRRLTPLGKCAKQSRAQRFR